MVNSLSLDARSDISGHCPCGKITLRPRATPCSRKEIGSDSLLRSKKRGARVITLVSLYFPSPSLQDKPMWTSSDFWTCDGIESCVSAAGASTLNGCQISVSFTISYLAESLPVMPYLGPQRITKFYHKFMAPLTMM
jgi:hypothetical protein